MLRRRFGWTVSRVSVRSVVRGLRARVERRADHYAALALTSLRARARRDELRAFRDDCELDPTVNITEESFLHNLRHRSALRVGARSVIRGELLVLPSGGSIEVGEWCYVGAGTRVWSSCGIKIGNRVLIAHNCDLHDFNAHPLDADARHLHFREIVTRGHPADLDVGRAPVTVEDDAWIGFGASVMKGVTIGKGSIVAARSVVTRSVPPWVLVAGNPARIVRELDRSREVSEQ